MVLIDPDVPRALGVHPHEARQLREYRVQRRQTRGDTAQDERPQEIHHNTFEKLY